MEAAPAHGTLERVSAAVGPDVTLRQLAILEALARAAPDPLTVGGLASKFGFSKPVVTRATKSLEQIDLVDRVTDTSDRRVVLIRATLQGRMMIVALDRIFATAVR